MSVRRRFRRAVARVFDWGYRFGRDGRHPWVYAFACGLESAWTVEWWRHDNDERASRYDGLSLAAILFIEAANVLRNNQLRRTQ